VRTARQEPELGAHTDEVLRALGVPDEALERLRAAGTIPAREAVRAGAVGGSEERGPVRR
jgi:hypothetical protein